MNEEKIYFYGLGPFYLKYQGNKVDGSNWISKRALYLLMYLLLAKNRKVAVEELVDIFWEESDLEDGKNKLYNTIYLLRRSLAKDGIPKDIVESVSGGYSINSSYDIWTDWDCFEKKTDQMIEEEDLDLEELDQLFQLYRGDFFPSLRYEAWTEIQREKLRENYLTLIEVLSSKLFTAQKYRDTINYLHRGIEHDPYREDFYLLYIKALVKMGRIAEAINSYKKCEQILKEELDVQPGQELMSEFQRIKTSRDVCETIHKNIEIKPIIEQGAMFCSLEIFQKIYELELRHVKRLDKEFVLLTIDFSDLELDLDFNFIIQKIAKTLRAEDVISAYEKKIFIILKELEVYNSGIIIKRFNQLCKELGLKKRPQLDIKEIN